MSIFLCSDSIYDFHAAKPSDEFWGSSYLIRLQFLMQTDSPDAPHPLYIIIYLILGSTLLTLLLPLQVPLLSLCG